MVISLSARRARSTRCHPKPVRATTALLSRLLYSACNGLLRIARGALPVHNPPPPCLHGYATLPTELSIHSRPRDTTVLVLAGPVHVDLGITHQVTQPARCGNQDARGRQEIASPKLGKWASMIQDALRPTRTAASMLCCIKGLLPLDLLSTPPAALNQRTLPGMHSCVVANVQSYTAQLTRRHVQGLSDGNLGTLPCAERRAQTRSPAAEQTLFTSPCCSTPTTKRPRASNPHVLCK